MSRFTLTSIQRARWREALRRTLRSILGRDVPSSELESRVAGYLSHTDRRSLGSSSVPTSSPLLRASDYAPKSIDDPLGGVDGLDVGRSWASAYEDLDCVTQALSEANTRTQSAIVAVRKQRISLDASLDTLASKARALLTQARTPFFGGPAPGQARTIFGLTASDVTLDSNVTTSVLLSGLACLPSSGKESGKQATMTLQGGQVLTAIVVQASDPTMDRQWIENPLGIPPAWIFTGTQTVTINLSSESTLLEILLGQSTKILSPTNAQISASGTTWIAIPPASSITLTFSAPSGGSVSLFKAHAPTFDTSAQSIWGPLSLPDSVNALVALTLQEVDLLVPTGTESSWSISTESNTGPWTPITNTAKGGQPLLLRTTEQSSLILSGAVPDSLSFGYYSYPIAGITNTQTGILTAGISQAKVDAFYYDWTQENDPIHSPQQADWDKPKSVVRTVAMGEGPSIQGNLGAMQSSTFAERTASGSCFGSYVDNKDWQSQSLSAIALTTSDSSNVLTPGYNYRFSWSIYAANGAYLPDLPIGLWNPDGLPGSAACPYTFYLNGAVVVQGVNGFSNYTELSGPPPGFGNLPGQYKLQQGTTLPAGPAGASWPPYCSRMNLTLRPGWNTLSLMLYIPTKTSLGRCAALIFGPDLLSDPSLLLETTGISAVRGWQQEWALLSEFDLRLTSPTAVEECWAWRSDSRGIINSILLNHNPNRSETGTLTLDNLLTGQPRVHQLSYNSPGVLSSPGTPEPRKIWVRAALSSSNPGYSPFIASFDLVVN